MNKKLNVKVIAQISLLVALMGIMATTPLGYIPLGFMRATTMHIPVIVGACLLGPKIGGILGFFFGITSVLIATFQPIVTSFVFTPFYSLNEEFSGNFSSLIVAIVPRILIGVIAGYTFKLIAGGKSQNCKIKNKKRESIAYAVAGFTGSIVNTIGVMSLIYIFFGDSYAQATNNATDTLILFILGVIGINGVPEAIIACMLNLLICNALKYVIK